LIVEDGQLLPAIFYDSMTQQTSGAKGVPSIALISKGLSTIQVIWEGR
jgi:hypothetical protein